MDSSAADAIEAGIFASGNNAKFSENALKMLEKFVPNADSFALGHQGGRYYCQDTLRWKERKMKPYDLESYFGEPLSETAIRLFYAHDLEVAARGISSKSRAHQVQEHQSGRVMHGTLGRKPSLLRRNFRKS